MKKFFYRVLEGDTIQSLSHLFNLCPYKIIKDNYLVKEICPGDLLFIESLSEKTYIVKPFEDKFLLCKKFNLEIAEFNLKNGDIPYIFAGLLVNI